jgi:hypothetical protein
MPMSQDLSDEELLALPIEPALLELGETGELPAFAVALCTLRYDEIAPTLRGILEEASEGRHLDGNEALFLFRGLHIIGYRRDPLAFKPLLRFLRLPPEEVEDLLGDATTETLTQIVAGVFDGDVDALLDAAVDLTIGDTVRDALIGAAGFLTAQGLIPRERFVAFLQRFHAERLAPDDDMAWYGWMNAIGLLGLRDMRPTVVAAVEAGALEKEWWEPEFFDADLAAAERAPTDIARYREMHLGYIDDLLAALERFHTGDKGEFMSPAVMGTAPEAHGMPVTNPWRDVGRNDPCPCGSGKKAKRCCLKA